MPPLPSGRKPTMFSTLRYTVRKTGWASIYTGISACLLRQMSYSLVRIGTYESIKRPFMKGLILFFCSLSFLSSFHQAPVLIM